MAAASFGGPPQWRATLEKLLQRNRSEVTSRYLQMATVRSDGSPANRTIVFRGFCRVEKERSSDETARKESLSEKAFAPLSSSAVAGDLDNAVYFITDSRSEKATELGPRGGKGEACWYLPVTRDQFRISGDLRFVTAETEGEGDLLSVNRKEVWKNLSDQARAQFAWPPPGTERSSRELFESPHTDTDPEKPLPNFLLMVLFPTFIDHLELKPRPNKRTKHAFLPQNRSWSTQFVNP